MAIRLSPTGIITDQTIEASQVSQSIIALSGGNPNSLQPTAYDLNISGSLSPTGSFITSGSE